MYQVVGRNLAMGDHITWQQGVRLIQEYKISFAREFLLVVPLSILGKITVYINAHAQEGEILMQMTNLQSLNKLNN